MNRAILVQNPRQDLRLVRKSHKSAHENASDRITITSFSIESEGKDAMEQPTWKYLGSVSDSGYLLYNKDFQGNDIPEWVFYVVERLFDIEQDRAGGPAKEEK